MVGYTSKVGLRRPSDVTAWAQYWGMLRGGDFEGKHDPMKFRIVSRYEPIPRPD